MSAKRILLVDDSNTALMVERTILTRGPYDVLVARDGADAVRVAQAEQPDLILMDMMMPKMNGLDAVRVLRDHDQTRDIPVIMVTTRGEEDRIEAGYEAGCNDYVTKPINSLELLAKIRNLLGE
jgi:CheY-like chemotaxis protein